MNPKQAGLSRPRLFGLARFALVISLCYIVAGTLTFDVPVAYAATPTLDCASPSTCVASAAMATGCNGGGNHCALSVSGTLSTSSTDTQPMVIAIVGVSSSAITIGAPTVGGTTMKSLCATSGLSPDIAVFYFQSSAALSSTTIASSESEGGNGISSTDSASLVAFAIQGQLTSGTVTDGTCFASSSTTSSTSQSVIVSGLTDSNDFVFGSVVTLAPPLTTVSGTQAANTDSQVGVIGGAVAYNLGSGSSSSSVSFSTPSSGAWVAAGAAIKDASGTPIPLFPEGVLPVLLVVPVLYIIFWRRRFNTSPSEGRER